MQFKDYYQTLGVTRDATADDFKKAFRKLARKYHPDVSKEADAELHMKEVNEAYAVLSDPEKRAAYDQLGRGYQPGQDFRPPPDWDAGFEFSGQGFCAARSRRISATSSPNCSVAWAARARVRARPRRLPGARRGSSRQGAARSGGRLQRRHPADHPARAAERRAGPGSADDAHPQREDSQGRARRPGDSPGGSGCARAWAARRRATCCWKCSSSRIRASGRMAATCT